MNKEICLIEAQKYNNRTDFKKLSRKIYEFSRKNEWIEEICIHMTKRKVKGWSFDDCLEEALKYKYKNDFRKKSPSAHTISYKNKWIGKICKHMLPEKNPTNFWNKERCLEEALKYRYKTEFHNNSMAAYNKCIKMNWIEEVTSHMITLGDINKRCIYAAIFEDGFVYIGLTCNIERRIIEHTTSYIKNTSVFNHIKQNSIFPTFIKLHNYTDIHSAIIYEGYEIDNYKKLGFKLLNKSRHGSLGKILIWNKEKCIIEAKKYSNRTLFQKMSSGAYGSARKNGWLNEICEHMI